MSRSATRSAGSPRRRRRQAGSSLVSVLGLTGVLALLVIASLQAATGASHQVSREGRGDVALQAADAGVNRYLSRLVEDARYYDHYVDQAEDPRVDPWGRIHPPGSPWTPGVPWTYRDAPDSSGKVPHTWVPLQDARYGQASYSLRIAPPAPGSDLVTIQSTARVGPEHNALKRAVQAQVHPTSIGDFQMISNSPLIYREQVTTTGKIYSSVSVNHLGVAKDAVYGQYQVCSEGNSPECHGHSYGNDHFEKGAYDSESVPSFSDKFPVPIDFTFFSRAIEDVRSAAMAGGIYRNDEPVSGGPPPTPAWLIQFTADGYVRIHKTRTSDPGRTIDGLSCPEVIRVPTNGAIFFEESVIVSDAVDRPDDCTPVAGRGPRESVVRGRVTVASAGDIYIGGDIRYAESGVDVLGLLATNNIDITEYAPMELDMRAATLAQNGTFKTHRRNPDGKHRQLNFLGAQVINLVSSVDMYQHKTFTYDETLRRLRPPYLPIIEGSWDTQYWREVTPPRVEVRIVGGRGGC